MSLKVGIVGLPNVGKSTLFNALLKKRVALSANYPFATVEPNIGIVAVPDHRLNELAELTRDEEKMTSLPPIVPAVCEFVDIAGLVKGAATGAGLGNKFLSHIREVDAIIHVLRDFEDPNIVREGSEDPKSDKETIETELILADMETITKMVDFAEKELRFSKDPLDPKRLEILKKIKEDLDAGKYIGDSLIKTSETMDEKIQNWIKTLPLLSIKPVLYVYNVSEEEYGSRINSQREGVLSGMTDGGDDEMVICAKVEEELVDLSDAERVEYLKELGVDEPGLDRLIKKAYHLLGLISYLTAGKKEVRAWTVKAGSKAPVAAGVIHTDFEHNFIRAQVVEYGKLIDAGSMAEAKKLGLVRTEGKEYIVKDGDVIEFLIGS
ncbi:MAG: redox-regulated ATPase YchF [Candidatus Daviesbacteria bacterium]|nr:redox-regulated ATPase YchF [Candidatus Daviesbacteria bacterium]